MRLLKSRGPLKTSRGMFTNKETLIQFKIYNSSSPWTTSQDMILRENLLKIHT